MTLSARKRASAGLFATVLLAAFAPWVSVTCAGTTVDVTGRELALGKLDANEEVGIASEGQESDPRMLVIAAFVVAIAGLGAAAISQASGAVVRAVLGGVGALLVIAARVDLSREISDVLGDQAMGITVSWGYGWWLALLGFALAIPLQFLGSEGLGAGGRPAPNEEAPTSAWCGQCGASLVADSGFCGQCGAVASPGQ